MSNKIVYTLTYFLLISSLSFSQTNNPLSTQNYFNLLVPSQNVPYDFILSVPDSAVQILFNPARAANLTTRFVYGTYNAKLLGRSHLNAPDIILTTLLKKSNTKWLFTFANGVTNLKSESRNSEFIPAVTITDVRRDFRNSSRRENSTTRMKLSMIKSTHFGGYSLGVFGIYNWSKSSALNERNETKNIFYETHQGVDSLHRYTEHNNSIFTLNRASKNSIYAAGIEYALSGHKWDFVASTSYQKFDNYRKDCGFLRNTSIDTNIHITPDTTTYYITDMRANRTTDYNVSNKPGYLVLNTYWQSKFGLITPDDHLFASLNTIYYTSDNIKYNYRENKEHSMSINSHASGDTLNTYSRGKEKGKFWKVRFSMGYILQKAFHKLYFFTGINPLVTYSESRDISNPKSLYPTYYSYYNYEGDCTFSSHPTKLLLLKPGRRSRYYYPSYSKTDLLINNKKIFYLSINLPFYFNFSPLKWLNLFGGFNYSYSYQYDKIESKNPEIAISPGDGSNSDNSYSKNSQNKSTKLQSYRMSYMGMSIKHHSGIAVDFAFNGNLAYLSRWNISVGYNF